MKAPKNSKPSDDKTRWFREHPILTTFLGVWLIGATGSAIAEIFTAIRGPGPQPPSPPPPAPSSASADKPRS